MKLVHVYMICAEGDGYQYTVLVCKCGETKGKLQRITIKSAKDIGFDGVSDRGTYVEAYLFSNEELGPV